MIDLVINGLKNQFLVDDEELSIEEITYQNKKLQIVIKGEEKQHQITFKTQQQENKNELKIMWCDYQIKNDWENITSFTANGFVSMCEILNIFYGVTILASDVLEVLSNE